MHTGIPCWYEGSLCEAVAEWGQCLQDAGISLHAYVLEENRLQSRHGSAASNLCVIGKGDPWTCELVITKTATLAIEVGFSLLSPLWQYGPLPGTWRNEDYRIEKIG